jgi:hypothetical protein
MQDHSGTPIKSGLSGLDTHGIGLAWRAQALEML